MLSFFYIKLVSISIASSPLANKGFFDSQFAALSLRVINVDLTVFIVSQRINTIRNADSIVVLDKGRIVGIAV